MLSFPHLSYLWDLTRSDPPHISHTSRVIEQDEYKPVLTKPQVSYPISFTSSLRTHEACFLSTTLPTPIPFSHFTNSPSNPDSQTALISPSLTSSRLTSSDGGRPFSIRANSRRLVDDVNVYDIKGDPRDIDWDGRACRRERVIGYGSVVGSESGVRSSDIVVEFRYDRRRSTVSSDSPSRAIDCRAASCA